MNTMTEAQLSALMDAVEWLPAPDSADRPPGELYATHNGVLDLFGTPVKVYRLNDGQAVFDADDVARWFMAGVQ